MVLNLLLIVIYPRPVYPDPGDNSAYGICPSPSVPDPELPRYSNEHFCELISPNGKAKWFLPSGHASGPILWLLFQLGHSAELQ